jgi:chitinase
VQSSAPEIDDLFIDQIPFNELVSSGALVKNSNGTYSASGGFTEGWDNCSDTPVCFTIGLILFVIF